MKSKQTWLPRAMSVVAALHGGREVLVAGAVGGDDGGLGGVIGCEFG